MYRRVIIIGGIAVVGGTYGVYKVNNSLSNKFKGIFSGFGETTSVCYDRTKVKGQLRVALDNANPSGIIFVCGRLSAGKTTTIRAVLEDRDYVAQINWRGKALRSEADLVDTIKSAFRIADFKSYLSGFIPGVNPGWLLSTIWNTLPSLDYNDSRLDELTKIQDEIEALLKFAQRNRAKSRINCRPVIFIDEIGALNITDPKSKEMCTKFVAWLVKISKDYKCCDIIVATTDAYTLDVFNLVDPMYVTTVIMPDLAVEDIEVILAQCQKNNPNKSAYRPNAQDILRGVGGNAGFVLSLCQAQSEMQFQLLIDAKKVGEMTKLKEVVRQAKKCRYTIRDFDIVKNYDKGGYEPADFHRLMETFSKHGSSDPAIPVDTLLRQSKVPEPALVNLVKSQVFFQNPSNHTVQVRSKLFLDVYKAQHDRDAQVRALRADLVAWTAIAQGSHEFQSDMLTALEKVRAIELALQELKA